MKTIRCQHKIMWTSSVVSNYFPNPIQNTRKKNWSFTQSLLLCQAWVLDSTHHSPALIAIFESHWALRTFPVYQHPWGGLGHILCLRITETEVRTWAKCSPDGQSMWCHQTLIFSVCGLVEMIHFEVLHWEDGGSSIISSIISLSLLHLYAPKEIIDIFALAILFFLCESFFLLETNMPQIPLQKILVTEFYSFLMYHIQLCPFTQREKSPLICGKCNKVMGTALTKTTDW